MGTHRSKTSTLALLCLALWTPSLAGADEPSGGTAAPSSETPSEVAAAAQAVVDEHCVGLTRDQAAAKADAMGAIGPVYSRVSALYERTGIGWLRYWRGVLEQCLGQDGVAEADLQAFVRGSRGDGGLSSLVRDGERRLRMLERRSGGGPPPGRIVGVVVGGGLAVGAVVSGVGLIVEAAAQDRTRQALHAGSDSQAKLDGLLADGAAQAERQSALLGLTAGLAAGSALSFVLSTLSEAAPPRSSLRVTGGPGDVGLGLEGRW